MANREQKNNREKRKQKAAKPKALAARAPFGRPRAVDVKGDTGKKAR